MLFSWDGSFSGASFEAHAASGRHTNPNLSASTWPVNTLHKSTANYRAIATTAFLSAPRDDTARASCGMGRKAISYQFEQALERYGLCGFGPWAVILRESDKDIGYRGLFRFNDINGQPEVELCYRIAKKYWDRGLATETATAVRDISLEQFAPKRPISLMDPDNRRSIRVAEKVGMVHTADVMLPGYTHPDRVYPCTRTSDNKAMQQTRDKAGSDGTSKVASR